MKKINNVNATLIHKVGDKKYTLNGKILAIDESSKTCTMSFGSKVANNIPLNEVYLNEAFIDDIKKLGKKAADKVKHFWHKITDIVKSAAGFILPVNENNEEIVEYINIPANIACINLPSSIQYAPSKATLSVCDEFGMEPVNKYDADSVFSKAEYNEKNEIEAYWTRVMKIYGESDKTLSEAVYYVNKTYYHKSAAAKALNEYAVSLKSLHPSLYGEEKNANQLIGAVREGILGQLDNGDGRVPLIWGAPGIGKTAILKKAAKMFRDYYDMNLDIITMACGALKQDDFELPDTIVNAMKQKQAVSIPKSWLPVFDHNGLTNEQIKMIDEYYNSGQFLIREDLPISSNLPKSAEHEENANKTKFDGGIIFFDELARTPESSSTIMMNICGDRIYANLKLASNWVMVAASNRLTDNSKPEADMDFFNQWDPAKFDRFQMYTYVPKKSEWISWARESNSDGLQNVDELIVSFIEQAPDGVWYDAIDLGSRDNTLRASDNKEDKEFLAAVANIGPNITTDEINIIGDYINDPSKSLDNMSKITWNGRDWQNKISKVVINTWLRDDLFRNDPDNFYKCFSETTRKNIDNEEYTVKNLDLAKLEEQLNTINDRKWNLWSRNKFALDDKEMQDLRNTDRLKFFIKCIGQQIKDSFSSTSLPSTEWDEYMSPSSVVNKNIKNIWTTGCFSAESDPQNLDNLYYVDPSNYRYDNINAWKVNPRQLDNACVKIWEKFKDFCTQKQYSIDFKEFITAIERGTYDNNAKIDKLIKDYNKQYSINLKQNKKKVAPISLLFANANEETQKQIAITLQTSEIAKRLANVALYFVKLSIQIGNNNPIDYILGDGKENSNLKIQYYDAFSNVETSTLNINDINFLAYFPAYCILTNGKGFIADNSIQDFIKK